VLYGCEMALVGSCNERLNHNPNSELAAMEHGYQGFSSYRLGCNELYLLVVSLDTSHASGL